MFCSCVYMLVISFENMNLVCDYENVQSVITSMKPVLQYLCSVLAIYMWLHTYICGYIHIYVELCTIILKFNYNFRNITYVPLTCVCMRCAHYVQVLKVEFLLATDTAA